MTPDPGRMAGRIALITGAAGDLGRATATGLAADGAAIVACDLDQRSTALEETVEACRQIAAARTDGRSPAPVLAAGFDVTDADAVGAAIDRIRAEVGVPDAVYNNAGYQGLFANTVDYDLADFGRVLEVNVRGAFVVLQACARTMIEAGKPGSIVNAASLAALGGPPNMVAYAASKAAVLGMTKTAAVDLAPEQIRVNAISPAFIGPGMMWDRQVELQAATPSQYYGDDDATVAGQMIGQVPLRRFGSVDEVASVVRFLLSDDASYLTGINIEIAGGAS